MLKDTTDRLGKLIATHERRIEADTRSITYKLEVNKVLKAQLKVKEEECEQLKKDMIALKKENDRLKLLLNAL